MAIGGRPKPEYLGLRLSGAAEVNQIVAAASQCRASFSCDLRLETSSRILHLVSVFDGDLSC